MYRIFRIISSHTEFCINKQRHFYTETLLHTNTFTHRHFYTQKLLHTNAFIHTHFYTQTLLHTKIFTHRRFCTQKLLHTYIFTHKPFFTQRFLHTETFAQRRFYTQTLLSTEAFTYFAGQLGNRSQFYFNFWRSNLISFEGVTTGPLEIAIFFHGVFPFGNRM